MGLVVAETLKTEPAVERSTARVIVVLPTPDGPLMMRSMPGEVSVGSVLRSVDVGMLCCVVGLGVAGVGGDEVVIVIVLDVWVGVRGVS